MLTSFTEGVWYDTGPVNIVGMRLTATMTVLDLGDGGLLVHSPLPLTPERRAAVLALGNVTELYAPNTFHHAWLGEWSQGFPEARVHAPAALASKRSDLRIDRFHDQEQAASFSDLVLEIPIAGFRLAETVLVYRPSDTAVVTDLVHNIGRPVDPWTKLYSRVMGFYDRVALSRVIRWTAFSDRRAARRSVELLLGQPFDRLIVGHGAPLHQFGREALAGALAFLPSAAPPMLEARRRQPPAFSSRPCG